MPTGKTERFLEIDAAYQDVERNYLRDMAAAKTVNQTQTVESNWSAAHLAWIRAINDALAKQGAAIEAAYAELQKANDAVKKARKNAEAFSRVLGKLKKASDAALKLATVAAGF